MASGEDALGFVFPAYAGEEDCLPGPRPNLAFADSANRRSASMIFIGGEEFHSAGGGPWTTEVGGLAAGNLGGASFRLDLRSYTEVGGRAGRPSFDREDVDEQNAETSGSLDYRSYSRFRGDLTLDLPFGSLTAARDAAHWGPGLLLNPVLNREAIPFFHFAFTTALGPLKVASLYGDLAAGDGQAFESQNLLPRSLFAHRFELALGKSWLLGVTEQLILFDLSKPFLFAPVFPLFVAKGLMVEDRTNGSIAGDLAWRSPFSTLFYGEFLLDDLESPSSLFTKDYVQNKWALLAGAHWSRAFERVRAGAVAEFGHVEPWVYAHFEPFTAQASHAGYPLGNPHGADSRTVNLKGYARFASGLYAGLKAGIYWKGTGPGAALNSPVPRDATAPKEFLEGEDGPDFAAEPEAEWAGGHFQAYLQGRIGEGYGLRGGVRLFY